MNPILKVALPSNFARSLRRHSLAASVPCRLFSGEAEVVRKEPPIFQYPKAQDLFERITATLSADDFRALQREMYTILGRPLRESEFYCDGFGGRKKRGDAGGAAEAAPVVEVKTVFDVKLVAFDAKAKIKIIKEIRSIGGLGLKEAKELVESAPCVIQKGLKAEAAEEIKAKLIEIGAEIQLV